MTAAIGFIWEASSAFSVTMESRWPCVRMLKPLNVTKFVESDKVHVYRQTHILCACVSITLYTYKCSDTLVSLQSCDTLSKICKTHLQSTE